MKKVIDNKKERVTAEKKMDGGMVKTEDHRDIKCIRSVTLRSVVLEVVLYSAVAVSGYILFKSGTKGNILENFPVSDGLVTTCKGAVGLTLILNLPLCMHPMRENFFAMISRLFYSNAASKRRSENTLNSNAYDIDIYDQDGIYDDNDDAKIIATPPLSYQSTPKLRGMGTPKLGVQFLGATACLGTSFVFPILMYTTKFNILEQLIKHPSKIFEPSKARTLLLSIENSKGRVKLFVFAANWDVGVCSSF
eukprot:jgi/Bigna1/137729/aug1.40_g12437